MSTLKVYVACGLTNIPEDRRASFEHLIISLKERLRVEGYEILEFLGLVDGTAPDVYRHDCSCVDQCDLLVAICDFPSIGLGMEINRAINKGKRVLALAHEESKVTRMVIGAGKVEKNVTFQRYTNLRSLVMLVMHTLPLSLARA